MSWKLANRCLRWGFTGRECGDNTSGDQSTLLWRCIPDGNRYPVREGGAAPSCPALVLSSRWSVLQNGLLAHLVVWYYAALVVCSHVYKHKVAAKFLKKKGNMAGKKCTAFVGWFHYWYQSTHVNVGRIFSTLQCACGLIHAMEDWYICWFVCG